MKRQSPNSCHFTLLRQQQRDYWLEAMECPETVLETAGHKISLRLLRYCAHNAPDIAYDIRHKLSSIRRAVILGYTIEMAGIAFEDDEVKIYVDEIAESMLSHRSIWSANFGHEWKKLWNTIQLFLGIRINNDDVPPEFCFPGCPAVPRAIINHTGYSHPDDLTVKKNKTITTKKPRNIIRQKSNDSMVPFAVGDFVVAINTDMSGPVLLCKDISECSFEFPDGPLRRGVAYQVTMTFLHPCGQQGVILKGMRVSNGFHEVPWHHSRFRLA